MVSESAVVVGNFIEDFRKTMGHSIESWKRACTIYVSAIKASVDNKELFIDAFPEIPMSTWSRIEAVGRGSVVPQLLTYSGGYYGKISRLPMSDQERVLSKSVEILLSNNDILKVKIQNLEKEQIEQLIAKDHIRSIPEQKAFMQNIKTIKMRSMRPAVNNYKIVRKGRIEIAGLVFTVKQLSKMIAEAS